MDDAERLQHILHARLPIFARQVARAEATIVDALASMHRPYLAFSGGVDSTVLLHLMRQQRPDVPVLWGDDGADFAATLAFLDQTAPNLVRVRSLAPWANWCAEMDRPDLAIDPAARAAWLNPPRWDHEWHTLTRDAGPRGGYDGVFLGMLGTARRDGGESRARWRQLHGGAHHTYAVTGEGGMLHCSPLAAWTKYDIWSYVVSRGVAYNPVYDRLAELGVPPERRRVSALTCFRVLQFGSHVLARQIDPGLWNRLAAVFPEVRRMV